MTSGRECGILQNVKRTYRLTLNIDKFILLDRTEARKLVKSKRKKVLDKRLPIWYNPTCQVKLSLFREIGNRPNFFLITSRKCDIIQNVKRRCKPPREPRNWTANQNKKLCGARRGADHLTRRTNHADGINESGRGDSSRRGPDTILAV